MTEPWKIETTAKLGNNVNIHIEAEQNYGYDYAKREPVLRDGASLKIDLSEFDFGNFGEFEVIFSDEKSMKLGNGFANYQNSKGHGFYTEWCLGDD